MLPALSVQMRNLSGEMLQHFPNLFHVLLFLIIFTILLWLLQYGYVIVVVNFVFK